MSKQAIDPVSASYLKDAIEWVGCPFLFNHDFRDDERAKIVDMIYEIDPGALSSRHRGRIQHAVYDSVLKLGYKESDH